MALLDRLWVLGGDDPLDFFLTDSPSCLRKQIEQHVLGNPGHWPAEYLFDELGAIDEGYAKGARADRELKLARYEVFRFGATELQNTGKAEPMLRQFFTDLFRQFDVTPHAA